LQRLSPELSMQFLTEQDELFTEVFHGFWHLFGLGHQRPPPEDWTTWLLLGGRGAGKTRAGAEWVRHLALTEPKQSPIALIGETEHDAREVMVEGVSGLLSVHESFNRPTWIPSRRRLQWQNGAVAQVFSAEDPESLRGPQFAAAWCDELAKWRHAEASINGFANLSALLMAYFGARFGVLGVYVSGRSREKQAGATGELPPTVLGQLLKALAPNKKK
jgi:phage terminase large subunit-like protein